MHSKINVKNTIKISPTIRLKSNTNITNFDNIFIHNIKIICIQK